MCFDVGTQYRFGSLVQGYRQFGRSACGLSAFRLVVAAETERSTIDFVASVLVTHGELALRSDVLTKQDCRHTAKKPVGGIALDDRTRFTCEEAARRVQKRLSRRGMVRS